MREQLKELNQQRLRFIAQVSKFSICKSTDRNPTILLIDIIRKDTGELVSDHVWFIFGSTFKNVNLAEGDYIEFNAKVDYYQKGWGRQVKPVLDYKLTTPTKIIKLENIYQQQSIAG